MKHELKNLEKLKEYLFKLRCCLAKDTKTSDWTNDDLENALKSFKNNKARDEHGHIYELFKFGGKDLKSSVLKFFNLVRKQQIYPDILQLSNISSFY